jgi:hypothetical protein
MLSMIATEHGEPDDAFNYLTVAIRYLHDAGRFFYLPVPLAVLVVLLDRLGRYESASTISGFAATSYTRSSFPKVAQVVTHLREVLARRGLPIPRSQRPTDDRTGHRRIRPRTDRPSETRPLVSSDSEVHRRYNDFAEAVVIEEKFE